MFKDPNFSKWLIDLGFRKDQMSNLLILPNKIGKKILSVANSKHAKRALHEGRHKANYYVKPITKELDTIKQLHRSGDISDCEARRLILDLQKEIAEKLKNGEMKLNDAEWLEEASKGAVSFMGLVSFTLVDPNNVSAEQQKMMRDKDIESAKQFFQKVAVYVQAQEYVPGVGGKIVDFFNPLTDVFDGLDAMYSILQLAPVDDPNTNPDMLPSFEDVLMP